MPTKYDDMPNTPLWRSKELILEYQVTQDKETFAFLLAKFDNYLVYLLHRFSRKYKVLSNEDMQELYHIAIIAFHKFIMASKPNHRPEELLLRMGSYVKYELVSHFRYKTREEPYEAIIMERREKSKTTRVHDQMVERFDIAEVRKVLRSGVLSKEDADFIKMRYEKGMTFKKIGKRLVVQECSAYKRGQKVLARIRILLSRDIAG